MRILKPALWLAAILLTLWLATHWEEVLYRMRGLGVTRAIEERMRTSGLPGLVPAESEARPANS